MNIGINATSWQNKRGYGRYERSLLNALFQLDKKNKYSLVFDDIGVSLNLPVNVVTQVIDTRHPTAIAASASGRRSITDMWHVSKALSNSQFDIVIFPTIYSFVPVFSPAKKIVIIHDIIPEKYPQHAHPTRSARLAWQLKSALGRWQANAIGTVSEYSRKCLIQHFDLPDDKVFVIGEASDPIFHIVDSPDISSCSQLSGINREKKLITYVGGFGPHKNLSMLVDVYSRLTRSQDIPDSQLIMVGENHKEIFHSKIDDLRNQIDGAGLSNQVIFTGFLSDDTLVDLLNLSTVLVLPSLMEGFGLPAIEAAACGCPVIATKASPLPELLGQGGIYMDPDRPEELQVALERVLTSEELRQVMRKEGLKAAGALTWEAAAQQLMQVIQQVSQS